MAEKKKAKAGETHSHNFQAEVAKLLHLMVHSVYSDRDVFLRELISNAADALDKLRYEAIAKPELLAGAPDLAITVTPDKTAKTLTVADNGIGMSEEELVDNLGTIAKSGTQAFMEQAKADTDKGGIHLIGQFGVGFYSSFMVAQKVEVISRKAGADEAFTWTSDGSGTFTVTPVKPEEAPQRGTTIVLHLKEDALEFLEDWKIEEVVRAYSDHIAHPIRLAAGPETTRQINAASAIWTRAKADITPDQYKEFFGHITGAYSDPALTLHYKAEGRNEYTVLLFVPGEKPFDLYDPERRGRQKLYVRRVFITSDAELLPAYLRFVRGVIDSEDMPLNISREMLQHNPQVAAIRKAVTNKVLAELKKCFEAEPEKAAKIWEAFGPVIKEGLYEDMERRDQLFEIARFNTTKRENVTLKDYVADLKTNQTAIYYLTAEDMAKAKASPQLEGFRARGIEVLLLTDAVDSFWVRMALGFDGKPFKSVTQGAADLDLIPLEKETPNPDTDEGATAALIAVIKQTLGDQVADVRKSARLTDSPVCLVASDQGLDRTLEKLLTRQGTTDVKVTAPILEINAGHALIQALAETAKKNGASLELGDASGLLLDLARVMDGERVADPAKFAGSVSALMQKAYG
ncbi:molecular chaperone HtpG [Nordella sp. HKS 07]|uniref:molecular chaperone HtpG n=1 Tax=Nordella sp. HKS 07 TaxID=2712222 RepID=UPI0013E1A4E2|nr:molecular chaperone HtpG [Nordella sp. HKS 07]QIG48126.1 molecular chaperone HtpG [Nordella sp. HKS 07]